jgi:hypothetical protein
MTRSKQELIKELKYEKEMLKQATTPHQRDSGKFKIRKIKKQLSEINNRKCEKYILGE